MRAKNDTFTNGDAPFTEEDARAHLNAFLEAQNRPLATTLFPTPILLSLPNTTRTKPLYAIGVGSGGLVVQAKNSKEADPPRLWLSWLNHVPYIIDEVDQDVIYDLMEQYPVR